MTEAKVIFYLVVTIVVSLFLLLRVIIGFTVVAWASGLFRVIRSRLPRRVAALQTKAVRTAEEPVPGRVT